MKVAVAIKRNPITGKEYNPCGSDFTWIMKDIKTVRGVKNRLRKHKVHGVLYWMIVSYNNWKSFDFVDNFPIYAERFYPEVQND